MNFPVRTARAFPTLAPLACIALLPLSASADFAPAALRFQDAAAADAPPVPPEDSPPRLSFLKRNSEWISFGVSYADDFDNLTEVNAYGSFSRFIEDGVEVIGELSVRYFDEVGGNAVGVNPAIVFRYHWWQSDEEATWTSYVDIGIGFMLTSDDVPQDGTSFNFTPRAGVGITRALTDHTRLLVGLRWSHISNARIIGDNDNPGTDAPMLHAGLIWEF